MVENLEGFPDSIRFLKNSKDWQRKAPLLTDLAYVKEQYRTSIENFLEPYLNYYVVEQFGDALQGIQLLSKAQKGKATFLYWKHSKTVKTRKRQHRPVTCRRFPWWKWIPNTRLFSVICCAKYS